MTTIKDKLIEALLTIVMAIVGFFFFLANIWMGIGLLAFLFMVIVNLYKMIAGAF
jgi:hypothetical protein